MALDQTLLTEFTEFAVQTAEAAGPIALQYFRTAIGVENKSNTGDFDPVTKADREIETLLRERIQTSYPDHGIAGEEFAPVTGSGSTQWVIDPIDGTRAYISGSPLWGIMLGLIDDGRSMLGVVHQPYLGETFYGAGGAAMLSVRGQARTLRTRPTAALDEAILYTTSPEMFRARAEMQAFVRLADRCRLRRFGGDCYAYCLLAAGLVDLVVEADLAPYDIIPLIPIIEAAGGIVSNWNGEYPTAGGRIIAAANTGLHEQALALLHLADAA